MTTGESYRSDTGLALGADANLVVFGPDKTASLRRVKLHMNMDYSKHERVAAGLAGADFPEDKQG